MLVLLAGVSGAGKSTIIESLHSEFGWKVVPTLTTRRLRRLEKFKFHLNDREFSIGIKRNRFLCVNEIYGARYGTPKIEIEWAEKDPVNFWVLDFPLDKVDIYFRKYKHMCFVIHPFSEEQLISQLSIGNRDERTKVAIDEYRKMNHLLDDSNFVIKRIINRPNQPGIAAFEVNNLASIFFNELKKQS